MRLLFNEIRVFLQCFSAVLQHANLRVDNLEEFLRRRNPSCTQFRPNGHIVEGNLKSPGRNELRLDHVAQEKDHHGGINFICGAPGPPRRRLHAKVLPELKGRHNGHDKEDLRDRYEARKVQI